MKRKKLELFVDKLNIYLMGANDDVVSIENINTNDIEQYNIHFKDTVIFDNDILEFKGKEANFKFNVNNLGVDDFKIDFGYYECAYDEFTIKYQDNLYRFTFENTLFF